MARPPSTHPTEGEMEILEILWRIGPAGLGAIRADLQKSKAVASTTVATMLGVMKDKALVHREDGPRGYLWSAVVSREATRTGLLGKLLDLAFDGSAHRLVAHLLSEGKLSEQDRESIRRMLESERSARPPKGGPKS